MFATMIRPRPIVTVTLLLTLAARAWALSPEPVSFNAADGMRISADYYPPGAPERGPAPMVLLLHGHLADRTAWEPLITHLHDAGMAVLALDLRGHGDSATTETRGRARAGDPSLAREMQSDLRGAYDWLAAQPRVDRARFALIGADLGFGAALQYAASDRSVDVLVGLSPGLGGLELDSAGDIAQITGRAVLLLAVESERDAPYTLMRRGSGVRVHVYEKIEAHGTDMLSKVPDIGKEITRFVMDGVGGATKTNIYGSINTNIYHFPDSGWIERIAPSNMRYYSSPQEAQARGLRASKSKGPSTGSRRRR